MDADAVERIIVRISKLRDEQAQKWDECDTAEVARRNYYTGARDAYDNVLWLLRENA